MRHLLNVLMRLCKSVHTCDTCLCIVLLCCYFFLKVSNQLERLMMSMETLLMVQLLTSL